jgi:hypothetical protein
MSQLLTTKKRLQNNIFYAPTYSCLCYVQYSAAAHCQAWGEFALAPWGGQNAAALMGKKGSRLSSVASSTPLHDCGWDHSMNNVGLLRSLLS